MNGYNGMSVCLILRKIYKGLISTSETYINKF